MSSNIEAEDMIPKDIEYALLWISAQAWKNGLVSLSDRALDTALYSKPVNQIMCAKPPHGVPRVRNDHPAGFLRSGQFLFTSIII